MGRRCAAAVFESRKKKLLRFGKDPLHAAGKIRIGSGWMFTVTLIGSSSNFATQRLPEMDEGILIVLCGLFTT